MAARITRAAPPAKKPPRERFLSACRLAADMHRQLNDPACRPKSGGVLLDVAVKAMERDQKHAGTEAITECNAILHPVMAVKINRSYPSENGRFAHGIVTYTNKNDRAVAAALVRCDAISGPDKVGTEEVPVTGPILSQIERTLDFMIPLAGRKFHHLECVVTLER